MRRIFACFICVCLSIAMFGMAGCKERREAASFVGWFFTAGWVGESSFADVDWDETDITLPDVDITLPAETESDEETGTVRYRFGGYPGISFFLLAPDGTAGYACGTSVFAPSMEQQDGETMLTGTLRQTDGTTALLYANEVYLASDGSLFLRPAPQPEQLTVGRVLSKTVSSGTGGQTARVTVTVQVAALPDSAT